ncbi:MAG: T9SS type A sorting domain-containing protein [Bacteroidetes bacterium]|nr:T9SS type A sorting domain-containing protein [Bacteroidota bacterium]
MIRVFSYGTSVTNEGNFTICVVDPLVGIVESTNTNNINIYPNPSSGTFTIETTEQESELIILNTLGEIILSQKIQNGKTEIDLSNQPNGIYFLHLTSENGTTTKKLSIQK